MYKIKSKIVDGILKYGLIDENLNEVAEFKYKEITPIDGLQNAYLLKSYNNKMSVFMNGLVINTNYKELIYVPSEICGYSNVFIAKSSKNVELIFIHKKYMEEKLEISPFKSTELFGKDSDVKIDDIKLESDGVCLYSNTEEGLVKGYFGHKILGNLKPEYVDIKSYSYVSSKPYIPKFNKEEYYTTRFEKDWESRYAIVTKRVKGKLKKGIIIRKKTEHGDKWEELIPPKYDDIIPQKNGDFLTINNKNGKPKKGLIHMTTYFDMWSKGASIYGCASLQKEFEIETGFDEVYRLTEIPAEYKNENDYIYYVVSKKGKLGLYKGRTMEARGNYDYCDHEHPDGPLLEKMLDCEYDSIESMIDKLNLKTYQRKRFIETFKATKGDVSSLVFDKKSENDEFVKTECEFKKVNIGCDNHDRAYYILEDKDNNKCFANVAPIPETTGLWKTTKYKLVMSSKYKNAYTTKTNSYTYLLIGEYEDGKKDVFDQNMEQKCSRVDKFKREDYYCISESTIEHEGASVKHLTVYNKSCEQIHEFEGSCIKYSYSEKTNSLYINVDGKIYIVDLSNNKVIVGEYTYIEILEDFMIYEQESGCGLNKLTKDGIVSILKPIYYSIEILFDINRIIVSKKDDEGKIKYGVFESNQGNSCLDVIYDSVSYENDRFTCTLGEETFYFDVDGFAIENPVALNLNSKNSTNKN